MICPSYIVIMNQLIILIYVWRFYRTNLCLNSSDINLITTLPPDQAIIFCYLIRKLVSFDYIRQEWVNKKNGNKNDETVFTTICYAHTTNIFDAMMQQRTRKHIQLFQTIWYQKLLISLNLYYFIDSLYQLK